MHLEMEVDIKEGAETHRAGQKNRWLCQQYDAQGSEKGGFQPPRRRGIYARIGAVLSSLDGV